MAKPTPLVLAVAAGGTVFVWSAIHGANVSSTFKDLLGGRAGQVPGTDPALSPAPGRSLGEVAGTAVTSSGNRANGQLQAAGYGWGSGDQWMALDRLWTRESGWNNLAQNPNSTAFGIAQFLDATWAPYGTKTSDATLQIRYGLAYIKRRYGDPIRAWQHETEQGWY